MTGGVNADTLNVLTVADHHKTASANMYQSANFTAFSIQYFGYLWKLAKERASSNIGQNFDMEFKIKRMYNFSGNI